MYVDTHRHTHTHACAMEYYLALKKNSVASFTFATMWMDLEGIILSEIS